LKNNKTKQNEVFHLEIFNIQMKAD